SRHTRVAGACAARRRLVEAPKLRHPEPLDEESHERPRHDVRDLLVEDCPQGPGRPYAVEGLHGLDAGQVTFGQTLQVLSEVRERGISGELRVQVDGEALGEKAI